MAKKLGIAKLYLKDDGLNPTASLKDRASSMGVAKAIEAGFQPVSLGKSRLRTETAALVAAHTLNLFNQK
jgi:threonine synthase